jgi:hypothetical protein
VIDAFDWFIAATQHDAEFREFQLVVNDERTMRHCNLTVDVKDRYGLNSPISVHAVGPFHEDVEEAKKLGIKAAVLAINAETPYRFVDFSYLKLQALEEGQQVTTYLLHVTRFLATPMVSELLKFWLFTLYASLWHSMAVSFMHFPCF